MESTVMDRWRQMWGDWDETRYGNRAKQLLQRQKKKIKQPLPSMPTTHLFLKPHTIPIWFNVWSGRSIQLSFTSQDNAYRHYYPPSSPYMSVQWVGCVAVVGRQSKYIFLSPPETMWKISFWPESIPFSCLYSTLYQPATTEQPAIANFHSDSCLHGEHQIDLCGMICVSMRDSM